MKKLIFTFAMFLIIGTGVNAQCIPAPLPEPGLSPSSDSLECFVQNQPANTVIYFQNFNTVSIATVEWLRIDSLTNMPCGLSYCMDQPDLTYITNENGCMLITGTPTSPVGQYKLGIYVTLKVSILPNPISGEAGALSAQFGGPDFSYYVRVKADSNAVCATLDTSSSANNLTGCTVVNQCQVGIKEASSNTTMTISPNPMFSSSEISFSLVKSAEVKVVIYNTIGKRVFSQDFSGNAGENKVNINRGDLAAGLYLVTVEEGSKMMVSRPLMIE